MKVRLIGALVALALVGCGSDAAAPDATAAPVASTSTPTTADTPAPESTAPAASTTEAPTTTDAPTTTTPPANRISPETAVAVQACIDVVQEGHMFIDADLLDDPSQLVHFEEACTDAVTHLEADGRGEDGQTPIPNLTRSIEKKLELIADFRTELDTGADVDAPAYEGELIGWTEDAETLLDKAR